MTIWFTADTHFGHANVIKYCDRPFRHKYEMDEVMITKWNERVKVEDIVFHLGDFSFYGSIETEKIIRKLNGHKILIRGNHDKGENYYLSKGFHQYFKNHYAITLNCTNEIINLSHYPYYEVYDHDDRKHKFADRMLKKQGNKWLLCGHVHEKWKVKDTCINVGVDQWGFAPVSLEEIIKYREEIEASRKSNS